MQDLCNTNVFMTISDCLVLCTVIKQVNKSFHLMTKQWLENVHSCKYTTPITVYGIKFQKTL